jgi:hypothetical protein
MLLLYKKAKHNNQQIIHNENQETFNLYKKRAPRRMLLAFNMVGDTRIELVTSSVSGKRSSSELITRKSMLQQRAFYRLKKILSRPFKRIDPKIARRQKTTKPTTFNALLPTSIAGDHPYRAAKQKRRDMTVRINVELWLVICLRQPSWTMPQRCPPRDNFQWRG